MRKAIFMTLLFWGVSHYLIAQKHAPLPKNKATTKTLPGVYPEASYRKLVASDMRGLTKWDLKIMRNEIYARHGYIFKTQEMIDYFFGHSWYNPRYNNVESKLSAIENYNIKFIQFYE